MYYIYGRVRAIPTYRVYRLYDSAENGLRMCILKKGVYLHCNTGVGRMCVCAHSAVALSVLDCSPEA